MTTTANELQSQACAQLEELFEQLAQVEGKAEILDGEIVAMSPTQPWPSEVAGEIYVSLRSHAKATGIGRAVTDGAIFRVSLPHRSSFTPDTAFHTGSMQPMRYYDGAPVFAVEVRSTGDYGPKAERQIMKKRDDYFACGTLVVWDVDLKSHDVVKSYRASNPDEPTIYRPGDLAVAESALPGWSIAVNDFLPPGWEPTLMAALD